jgi:hypothetical protein
LTSSYSAIRRRLGCQPVTLCDLGCLPLDDPDPVWMAERGLAIVVLSALIWSPVLAALGRAGGSRRCGRWCPNAVAAGP